MPAQSKTHLAVDAGAVDNMFLSEDHDLFGGGGVEDERCSRCGAEEDDAHELVHTP